MMRTYFVMWLDIGSLQRFSWIDAETMSGGCNVFRHAHGVRLCFTTVFESESYDILQLTEENVVPLLE